MIARRFAQPSPLISSLPASYGRNRVHVEKGMMNRSRKQISVRMENSLPPLASNFSKNVPQRIPNAGGKSSTAADTEGGTRGAGRRDKSSRRGMTYPMLAVTGALLSMAVILSTQFYAFCELKRELGEVKTEIYEFRMDTKMMLFKQLVGELNQRNKELKLAVAAIKEQYQELRAAAHR
eukprot:TRINITY_DN2835_c0_g1_i1.p1 TRINITY_DN2835_c0_g1~~TRINITY_DN2835_c0_g1_i1.p1  ORF type:complete len:179 (-),score=28.50 TRINITY_DN2835_c0_g1_i1:310-846(-)